MEAETGVMCPPLLGGPVSPALVQFHTLRGAAVCREISAALVALAFVNRLLGPSPLPRGL